MTMDDRANRAGKSPFGELLTRLRTQHGLTQEGLALATEGDRISSRSITNYERNVTDVRNWILPHRPGLQTLSTALQLDPAERRLLVEAWNETKALKDARSQSDTAHNFVSDGRAQIVDRIMSAWEQAIQGKPQFVMLGGDSGIGKTTLSRHVSDRIAANTKRVLVSWGVSQSWATPIDPYMAFRYATDRLLVQPPTSFALPGLYPNRPALPASILDKVIESVPLLGGVLISESTVRTLGDASEQHSRRTVDAMLEARSGTDSFGRWLEYSNLLLTLSQVSPILIVLDDLHWVSDNAISLLQHVVHHLSNRTDVPLMIVSTFRSDELLPGDDGKPHPLAGFLNNATNYKNVTRIHMQETLTPQNGKSFVAGILKNLPMENQNAEDTLMEWLYDQTSGQPMLTLEMIRHLRETGALVHVPRSSSWRFDVDRVSESVSTPISTLFDQRLTNIDRRYRYMLEVASAMGETILPEVMADVMNLDEDEMLDDIDGVLVDRHELMQPGPIVKAANRSHPTFRFPHALLREYIYSQIRPARKRKIHLDIATSLTHKFADTNSLAMGQVTHHHILAEDWHSAQMSAYRVAQLQAGRLDWELATVWFDQAEQMSALAEDARQMWRAKAARLAVMRGLNQSDEAIKVGQSIIQTAKMHGWKHTLGLAYHHLGEIYYDLGELDRSVEHIEMAMDIHMAEQTFDLAAAGQAMLSHTTYRQGRYDVAREHARRALAYAQETHNSWVRSEAMLAAANCDLDLGFYHDAIESYRGAIELAAMSGKLSNQFLPALNIGLCYVQLGDYERAKVQINATIDQLKSVRVPGTVAWARLYLGYAYEGQGDLDAALENYTSSVATRRQRNPSPVVFDSIAGQLSIATKRGNAEVARKHLSEIVDHIDSHGLDGLEDAALLLLSVARAHQFLENDEEYWERLEQAQALVIGRASMIQDGAASNSYLTAVPTNAEIQQRMSVRAKG